MHMQKNYQVRFIDQELTLTGCVNSQYWQGADVLSDFHYPWQRKQAPKTEFRALFSKTFFYFMFKAQDRDIQRKSAEIENLQTIDCERVELFFGVDKELSCYFPVEIDPLGRVLDAQAHYYRQFDFDWQWPRTDFKLFSSMDDDGYIVEGAISLESLTFLGILKTEQAKQYMQVGVFRAHYEINKANQRAARWISWVTPDAEQPDFHIPSAFGLFEFST